MTKHVFTPHERHAVFTIHHERCYMCNALLTMRTMEVDHIIPESLQDDAPALAASLEFLGLPADFDVNSFANWMPACRPCNGQKRSTVFRPSLQVQLLLQHAADTAAAADALAKRTVREKDVSKALNTLQRASEDGALSQEILDELKPLASFQITVRDAKPATAPIRLTPLYSVLSDADGIQIVRGPFGIGGGPSNPSDAARCPSCGAAAWNGARCVICGTMDDD